jgi:hypothetical protein
MEDLSTNGTNYHIPKVPLNMHLTKFGLRMVGN